MKSATAFGAKRKMTIQQDIFNFFLPKFPYNARVLEIGSGRGEFAYECLSRKLFYIGIEPSKELYKDFFGLQNRKAHIRRLKLLLYMA